MMKKFHLCDAIGILAVIGLIVGVSVVSSDDLYFVLYVGLAVLAVYAYLSFEIIPKRRSQKASEIAVAYREVLPPTPIPVEQRNGHTHPSDQRGRPALLRVAA